MDTLYYSRACLTRAFYTQDEDKIPIFAFAGPPNRPRKSRPVPALIQTAASLPLARSHAMEAGQPPKRQIKLKSAIPQPQNRSVCVIFSPDGGLLGKNNAVRALRLRHVCRDFERNWKPQRDRHLHPFPCSSAEPEQRRASPPILC